MFNIIRQLARCDYHTHTEMINRFKKFFLTLLSINQSNLVFVKRCLNKVLSGASYE